ncbi:MAG: undecaprenyldiphospho-muramoylpentapeptide beta-N-acetylglucosaminyltransferase [Bacilli bacterium]|nr:undecaprenyldiphospho-muramoylpentapeptide beta-N-acetylglucosaminyltransferase [Bacilli bacterium]
MKAIICAGGTGGHVFPALAIINKIKEKDSLSRILYIGTTDRMEKDLIPKLGIPYEGIEMEGISRKNIFKNIPIFIKYKKAVKRAKKIIKEFNPDIVIGVGGYITAPVMIAAHKLKYKTMIHEQNSVPGVSNKLIAKYADRVCVSLPNTLSYFDKEKTVYTGNPRSEEIISTKVANKKDFGLMENKKLVMIVMGSLGSTTMTKKIKELIPAFNIKDYQVIIITGENYYDSFKSMNLPKNVAVVPFLENFIQLLKKTDLIISRAGASTISEITAIGLPSILVPSPYVTANHQYLNAKELEENGATKLINEEDFSMNIVISAIDEILMNREVYDKMKRNALKLGVKDSATRFYEEIKKVIKEDRR